jgi:GTP-binding protein Era
LHLPAHPPYFPGDELSDRNLRFFASEIIRENILLQFQQEVPYCCEVQVDEFNEKQEIFVIKSTVFVGRESQKSILIGEGGKAIKRLGMASRKRLEDFLGIKVFLEINIKVAEDWRSNASQIKRFGY